MHDFAGMGWGMGWTWIVGLIGIIVVIVIVLRAKQKNNKSAIDILKERYANGEISKEEFEEKKNGLL